MYHKLFNIDAAYAKLRNRITHSRGVSFWKLRNTRLGYTNQSEILAEHTEMFTAALIHYDLDPTLVICVVQGELTGEHRDINESLAAVKGLISDADFDTLERVYRTSCPYEL